MMASLCADENYSREEKLIKAGEKKGEYLPEQRPCIGKMRNTAPKQRLTAGITEKSLSPRRGKSRYGFISRYVLAICWRYGVMLF